MVRYSVFAEETATVLCDEDVVFDAYAAEVLVSLNLVEVEELGTMARSLPVVDECGDEVDAWLVSHDETFLQTASHAQAVCTELVEARACFLIEANVDLVETFHVVYSMPIMWPNP